MLPLLALAALLFVLTRAPSAPVKMTGFSRAEFHKRFAEVARRVDWRGIPWRFALAQSDLETGHGTGGVFAQTQNLFSITRGGWTGEVYKVPSNGLEFRKYRSWEESMTDWVKLMHYRLYAKALTAALANDFKGFAREIKAAGYDATNPKYASALESVYATVNV